MFATLSTHFGVRINRFDVFAVPMSISTFIRQKKAENNKQIDIQNRWTDCVDRQNDKLIKVYINMVQA